MTHHPKFRKDLNVSDYQGVRGDKRVILKDLVSEKYYYLSDYEFRLLQVLDGTLPIEEVVENLKASGYYYSLQDASLIVAKAAQMGLVLGTKFGTGPYQKHLQELALKAKKSRRLTSIYFLFIPLMNPDSFLDKTLRVVRLFANKWTATAVALLLPGAIYLLILGIPKVQREFLCFFNWQNLLHLWAAIALVKLLHEFAHAYVAKSFGLRVPQMGIAFLIFFPCLYCNTTDAWQLADRRQRMLISAAGILVEASLAIISSYVWYFSKPGLLHSLAFYFMAVSFISSVLFNGNPLMRFDGYFILMDYLRIPNLSTRSFQYIKYLFMYRVLGISTVSNPATEPRETMIFTFYGMSAALYRVFLYSAIVMGVYFRFDKTLGLVLAVLAFSIFIVRPIVLGVRSIGRQKSAIRPKPLGALAFTAVLLALVGPFLIPISRNSVYPCYLTSTQIQKLTVPRETLVKEVFVREGSVVRKGDILFTLEASPLRLSLLQTVLEKRVLEMELAMLLVDDMQKAYAATKEIEISQVDATIMKIRKELALASGGITAPFDGVVTILDFRMQEGFQPGEGVVVGELESGSDCAVHALIPEKDVGVVSVGREVWIWFPIGKGLRLRELVTRIKPYSERDLENSPFSSRVGGEVATENPDGDRSEIPLEAQYECIVDLTAKDYQIPLGMTGKFVVGHPARSIAATLMEGLIKTFNRESLL